MTMNYEYFCENCEIPSIQSPAKNSCDSSDDIQTIIHQDDDTQWNYLNFQTKNQLSKNLSTSGCTDLICIILVSDCTKNYSDYTMVSIQNQTLSRR